MAYMCGAGCAGGRALGGGGAPDQPDQGGAGQALLSPLLRHHHPRPLDPDRAALDGHNRWLHISRYVDIYLEETIFSSSLPEGKPPGTVKHLLQDLRP